MRELPAPLIVAKSSLVTTTVSEFGMVSSVMTLMDEVAILMTAPSVIASSSSVKDLIPPTLGWGVAVGVEVVGVGVGIRPVGSGVGVRIVGAALLVGSGVGTGLAVGDADGAEVSHIVSVHPLPQLSSQQFDNGAGLPEDAGAGLLPEKAVSPPPHSQHTSSALQSVSS